MSTYQVINLKTDESHGFFDTFEEARGCVSYDRLTHYQIWRETVLDGDRLETIRVEDCDPYEGDDDRVKQAYGLPNVSERVS